MKMHCQNQSDSFPQFADILATLAVSVGAGVRVRGGVEGGNGGVGIVLACGSSTGEREDTADSEGRGTGSRATSSETGALTGSVASSVEIFSPHAVGVRELYYFEN